MKKKLAILILSIFLLTGCSLFKSDALQDVDVYTTTYPVKYLIDYLYGDNATIHSIYPSGVNFKEYELSEKKLNEQDGQNKTNIEWSGWDKTSNRPIDYKNGLINIKINPKQGAFCFYVIKEETVTDEEINKIIQSIKKENSKASKKLKQKGIHYVCNYLMS